MFARYHVIALLFISEIISLTLFITPRANATKKSDVKASTQNNTCHHIGVLSKLAAQQRDAGKSIKQTQTTLETLLIKGNSNRQQMARKLLMLPIGLTWINKDLTTNSLYSLGYFICLAGHNKLFAKTDTVYLIHATKLCQKRTAALQTKEKHAKSGQAKINQINNSESTHKCMQLAYLLLLKNKLEKLKQQRDKKLKKSTAHMQ